MRPARVGEDGGGSSGEARCATQGATAAMPDVPSRALVHLPLHGPGVGALGALGAVAL